MTSRTRWLATGMVVFALGAVACQAETEEPNAASGDDFGAGTSFDPYANLDTALGESVWPNEKQDIQATAQLITDFLERRYRDGRTDDHGHVRYMRDAHAKTHGCVKGEFTVRDDVPADYRVGVFKTPLKKWKTWVRYSNGNSEVRHDWRNDARGMAIKLANVDGEKLVTDFPETSTQDFVMINHPVFFVDNPAQYADTLKVFHSGAGWEALNQVLSVTKLPLANALLAIAVNGSQIKNPILEPYWSMTAYRLGKNRAAKYAVLPIACGDEKTFPSDLAAQKELFDQTKKKNSTLLPSTDRDSLRTAMEETLQVEKKDACFVFVVQPAVSSEATPVEQSTVNWDDAARFYPVANLRIPAQTFSTEAQDTFCDDMTFTPWHTLSDHKPLGVVNRMRLVVYAATSKLRREGNHVTNQAAIAGPTGEETF